MDDRRCTALAAAAVALLVSTALPAATLTEDFATDPASRGWQAYGDTNLFHWNPANFDLEVTWDSSRSNSYFCLPLPATLTEQDDFSASFELRLSDVVAGIDPQKPNPFQLALGFFNLAEATGPGFIRGTGFDTENLVEFSFFPDPGPPWLWGPSLTATMTDWTGTNWSTGGFAPTDLSTGDLFRISLEYTAGNRVLRASLSRNGEPYLVVDDAVAGVSFLGFRVDHVGICSYSDEGQDPFYSGSILAHGTVENVVLTTPAPVGYIDGGLHGQVWQAQFRSRSNWWYAMERTIDFQSWTDVTAATPGDGNTMTLQDTNPPPNSAFYRVRAQPQ